MAEKKKAAPKKTQKKTTLKKKTYVALVLDSSGSMSSCENGTISAFNEQLNVLEHEGNKVGDTYATFVVFGAMDKPVELRYENKPVSDVEKLTHENYKPYGSTPMYDGVGTAIKALEKEDIEVEGEDRAFLVVTLTDGYENASREYTASTIAGMVKKLQDKGNWTFVYLGANQDLSQVAQTTGMRASNMKMFEGNEYSMPDVQKCMSNATANYMSLRSSGLTQVENYWQDNQEEVKTVEEILTGK
jgi:uncharacterized protein YegL